MNQHQWIRLSDGTCSAGMHPWGAFRWNGICLFNLGARLITGTLRGNLLELTESVWWFTTNRSEEYKSVTLDCFLNQDMCTAEHCGLHRARAQIYRMWLLCIAFASERLSDTEEWQNLGKIQSVNWLTLPSDVSDLQRWAKVKSFGF